MIELQFFSPDEFKRCTPACDIEQINADFLRLLDNSRLLAGVPFKLNCAFRSRQYDLAKGRSGKSFHCLGRAVDISCTDSSSRAKIVRACLHNGLTCGIADNFIHVDDRPNQLIFLY